MTAYNTAIVVHDNRLRDALRHRPDVRHVVLAPCAPTLGMRLEAVWFLDRPTPEQCSSELWLEVYRMWIDTALKTRLVPEGHIFGMSEWAA